MRIVDADEISCDILDGEIEITGEGAEFARQAVETYKAVILRRIMAQPTEKVIMAEDLIDIIFSHDADAEAIVELICRKLFRMGLLRADGDNWKVVEEE